MTKSGKNKSAFHAGILLLLLVGMLAGYYWLPLLGVILELAFWIYCGLFTSNEQNSENT